MVKNHFHKVLAFTLALLMFSTSTGFSMDFHYCQGKLKSIALFGEAKSCHQKMVVCPMHGTMKVADSQERGDCCSNESLQVENLDVDYNLASIVDLPKIQWEQVSLQCYDIPGFDLLEFKELEAPSVKAPPLLSRDIYVLNEAFLL